MTIEGNLIKGRVIEVQKNIYTLTSEYGSLKAQLKGSFYQHQEDTPAVGDYVMIQYNSEGISLICEIVCRRNILKRPDQSGHAAGYVKTMKEQVLAANFEYVFIVTSLNKNFNINRITRYISVSLQSNAIPVVILTKADLCENAEDYIKQVRDISKQTEVYAVSAVTEQGMEQLDRYFEPGVTIVLAGSSGVGKSTMVNAIAGEELMKVSEIRESDSRGHHTTTHRQLITFSSGVTFIDSPGIREIGMCDVTEGINDTFPDIEELFSCCRFSDCHHEKEPGCAVQKALEDGTLNINRWRTYINLIQENKWGTSMLKRRRV